MRTACAAPGQSRCGTTSELKAILAESPAHFDAQLSLGMAYYRKGDYAAAITAMMTGEAYLQSAKIAGEPIANFGFGRVGIACEQLAGIDMQTVRDARVSPEGSCVCAPRNAIH